MSIPPISVKTFQLEPKMSAGWWCWRKTQDQEKVIGIHCMGSHTNFMTAHLVAVEIFYCSENFDLLLVLDEWSGDH